ncbi:MAG: DUF960 domain-containing protein [Acholeplasmataceae bacterium]|nr:DUF960 domain-containing protein [Acholeplasmataceae bacterium]HOA63358.1 DUF960 family protein [Bacilli bacterium]HQA19553.1 DUF960 family protein [Bacilli bacterium]HQD92442.1 DUF960 family protein [Bacilli bacterium]
MFSGQRFKTKGINQIIPENIQTILWYLLDEHIKNFKKVDYLQIFSFDIDYDNQIFRIIHEQEQPEYKMIHEFKLPLDNLSHLLNQKVYIIDNGSYNTMLLTDEY